MFLEVIYREEVVRRNNMNKDRDELTQWGRAISIQIHYQQCRLQDFQSSFIVLCCYFKGRRG